MIYNVNITAGTVHIGNSGIWSAPENSTTKSPGNGLLYSECSSMETTWVEPSFLDV